MSTAEANDDLLNLAPIQVQRLGRAIAEERESEALASLDEQRRTTEAADAELVRLDQQVADIHRRRGEREQQIRAARAERGEALADGAALSGIDKRIVALQADVDRAHDELRAVESRREKARKEALIRRWDLARERCNALDAAFAKIGPEAQELRIKWELALNVRELLRIKSDGGHIGRDAAYKAILDHKAAHPHLYPE